MDRPKWYESRAGVEAIRLTDENGATVQDWMLSFGVAPQHLFPTKRPRIEFTIGKCVFVANVGDWIVRRGANLAFETMSDGQFTKLYF